VEERRSGSVASTTVAPTNREGANQAARSGGPEEFEVQAAGTIAITEPS
jgi:hypothetical protein